MSPLRRQSTIFLQAKLTEEFTPESPWTDGVISASFHNEPFSLLEGTAGPLDAPPMPTTDHLLLSYDDDIGPPSATSGDAERVNFADFTMDASNMSYGDQPDDLFDHTYQAAYTEMFHNDNIPYAPAQAMPIYEPPQPLHYDQSVATDTIQVLSDTHSPSGPVGPSTMTTYPPYFDYGCDASKIPTTPGNASVASLPPPTPHTSSSRCDSSESDGESDADYFPPSDDDDEYCPTQAASPQKQKKSRTGPSQSKSPRCQSFSPALSTSSESEKSPSSPRAHRRSHPYRPRTTSRNLQRIDGVMLIDKETDFHCPVLGCSYIQTNQRVPDLKRHVMTHDRWLKPDEWTCCGVDMNRAHLYGKGIEEGMTREACIEAGAYEFRGQLMIGGCMKTFARRDALKRHVDNPKIPCVGHMDSYPLDPATV